MTGIEPVTSSLPRKRSTPELHRLTDGAEDEIRTRDIQLGRLMLYQLSYFRLCTFEQRVVGVIGFEPIQSETTDLQSAPALQLRRTPWHFVAQSCVIGIVSRWRDSNPRPADYKSAALASELHRQHFKEQGNKNPPGFREGKCMKEIDVLTPLFSGKFRRPKSLSHAPS